MAENTAAEGFSTLSNIFTGADLAWCALVDSLSGNPLGTTATSRYGALASAFGAAEQLAIWNASEKTFDDFERFANGMATNLPGVAGALFMPKKWFDDYFDKGPKEAETLGKLIDLSKKLKGILEPIIGVGARLNLTTCAR